MKKILLILLLVSCTPEEEMRFFISNINSPQTQSELSYKYFDFEYNPTNDGVSYSTSIVNGVTVINKLLVNHTFSHSATNLVSYGGATVNGTNLYVTGDNTAPIYYKGMILGGKHGYATSRATISGHGKTYSDLGSVWTDGIDEIVLFEVNGDILRFITREAANGYVSPNIYTHVSGATNTGNIDLTTLTNSFLLPSTGNKTITLEVDGVTEDETSTATFTSVQEVKIIESYDIFEKLSMVESLILANDSGRVAPFVWSDFFGDTEVRVTTEYIFNGYGNISSTYKVEAIVQMENYVEHRHLQHENLLSDLVNDKWYLPKATIDDWATLKTYQDITVAEDFTTSEMEAGGLFGDVFIAIKNGVGLYSQGFLPVKDSEPTLRRTLLSQAFGISTGEKMYSRAVMATGSAVPSTLTIGTSYETVGYKMALPEETGRTAHYFIPYTDNGTKTVYMRADWHTDKTDNLTIPTEFQGRTFTIVEKSNNVTVSEGTLGSTLTVVIDNSKSYGYLFIKII